MCSFVDTFDSPGVTLSAEPFHFWLRGEVCRSGASVARPSPCVCHCPAPPVGGLCKRPCADAPPRVGDGQAGRGGECESDTESLE